MHNMHLGAFAPPYITFIYVIYEGHSKINNNEFISQKVSLDSDLFFIPHEDTYMAYLCQKFGAFIMAKFDAMVI